MSAPPDAVVTALRAAGCVWAEDEARLLRESSTDPGELAERITRRVAGEPLEHILGWAQFGDHRVTVGPGVFVPRPRSLLLVRLSLPLLPTGGRLLDLCCGSGAIALAVAMARPDAEVHAADLDPVAVTYARRNLDAAGAHVHEGDLFNPVPEGLAFDVVVANTPYVPTAELTRLPPEAREHEPRRSLDGGSDGLDLLRRIAAEAAHHLTDHGHLLMEIDESQAHAAIRAYRAGGLLGDVMTDEETDTSVAVGRRA